MGKSQNTLVCLEKIRLGLVQLLHNLLYKNPSLSSELLIRRAQNLFEHRNELWRQAHDRRLAVVICVGNKNVSQGNSV